VNIQEEIHMTLKEITKKLKTQEKLSDDEIETLFLTSLIEEEG